MLCGLVFLGTNTISLGLYLRCYIRLTVHTFSNLLRMFWNEVKKGLVWNIHDGMLVNFWNDVWMTDLSPLNCTLMGLVT